MKMPSEFPLSDGQPLDFEQMMIDLGFTVLPEPEHDDPEPEPRTIVTRIKMTATIRSVCNNGKSNEDIARSLRESFTDQWTEDFAPDDDRPDLIPVGIESSHCDWTVTVEDA